MRFYTINAIAKGEYESVPDEQGMWVSRTAAEARIAQLQEALADALDRISDAITLQSDAVVEQK